MKTYLVTFERVGRNHNVTPLTCEVDGPNHLAESIYNHTRPHLGSHFVEVDFDLDAGTGEIFCGVRVGGTFTVAELCVADGCTVPVLDDTAMCAEHLDAYIRDEAGEHGMYNLAHVTGGVA